MAEQTDGRRRRAERNEAAVSDALVALFREGQFQPGAAAIAARAGVSERTVYRLFDDLEALAAVTIARQLEQVAPLLAEMDSSGSRAARVAALVEQRLTVYAAFAPVFRAGQMRAPLSPTLRRAFAQRGRWSRGQIARLFGPELAALPVPEQAELVAALDVAVSQEVLDYLHTGGAPDVAAVVRRTLGALLAGACPEPAPSPNNQ